MTDQTKRADGPFPLPWCEHVGGDEIHPTTDDEGTRIVADIDPNSDLTQEECLQLNNFIVVAANNHDKLVAELELVAETIHDLVNGCKVPNKGKLGVHSPTTGDLKHLLRGMRGHVLTTIDKVKKEKNTQKEK